MQTNPYLNFNGQCEEAFRFYEGCLGGTITVMMNHGDSPMKDKTPVAWHDAILHARLEVGDTVLMGSDAPPEHYEQPKGLHVSLTVDSSADAERIFAALAENGSVQAPIAKTFWAERFGMLVDRFGIPWIINYEQRD